MNKIDIKVNIIKNYHWIKMSFWSKFLDFGNKTPEK